MTVHRGLVAVDCNRCSLVQRAVPWDSRLDQRRFGSDASDDPPSRRMNA